MVEKIIDELRRSSHGAGAIARMAEHTVADTYARKVIEAQRHLAHHIQTHHGGRVDQFLWYEKCDPGVFVRAVELYGRKQVGLR